MTTAQTHVSQWCHPTILSSVTPFFCPQSFPASGSSPVGQLLISGGHSTGASASASVLPTNIQVWFHLGFTNLVSLLSKGLLRVFTSTTAQKHQFDTDPVDVGNMVSGSSAFPKSSLCIWKLSVERLLKPSLKDFEHYLASMWSEHICVIVWTFFGIALLWDWNENWPFPVPWPLQSFPNLLAHWVQHFNSTIF